MTTQQDMITYNELKRELAQCYGTEHYYKRAIFNGIETGMVYTDGVKTFCGLAEAQWFIDVVNSYMPKIKSIDDYFFVVKLLITKGKRLTFLVEREDVNTGKTIQVVKQFVEYTDLPINQSSDKEFTEYKFFLVEQNKEYVLMLPSEY